MYQKNVYEYHEAYVQMTTDQYGNAAFPDTILQSREWVTNVYKSLDQMVAP